MPEKANGWAGMLSLSRELTLDKKGQLRMNPVKELELLRGDCRQWQVSEYARLRKLIDRDKVNFILMLITQG